MNNNNPNIPYPQSNSISSAKDPVSPAIVITSETSIADYLLWWDVYYKRLAWSTKRSYHHLIVDFINPCLGSVLLGEYRSSHADQLKQYIFDHSGKASVRKGVLRIFRIAMKDAYTAGVISNAFADHLQLPDSDSSPIRIYSPHEISSILKALHADPDCNLYLLIYYTLITGPEALGIVLDDIDLASHQLCIRRRLHYLGKDHHYYESLYDENRRRTIYLSAKASAVITNELQRRSSRQHSLRWNSSLDDGSLFTTSRGNHLKIANLNRTRRIVQTLTSIPDFNIQSFRLTAAYACLQNGISEKVLQDVMGYRSLVQVYRLAEKLRNRTL